MNQVKRTLFFPISLLYGLITALRNLCYDWGILKSYNFREHVISVGNLAVGGTGKSPHIEYLNQLLKDQFSVANLSRGYSRKTRGYMEVFAENTAEEVGDEPKQFKTKFPDISVAVDADRLRGIKQLLKKKPKPEIILLDDAFQHRRVKPGLNILLTDFRNLFVNDSMLPGGFLREYPSNYRRADIIIITKTPERITHLDLKVYSKEINLLPHQKLFFSWIKFSTLHYFSDSGFTMDIPQQLFKFNVMVITGIANPYSLITYIKEYANSIVHKKFGDHHHFTIDEIEQLRKEFNTIAGENKIIITTEKDFMRLQKPELLEALTGLPLFILPIEIDFKNKTDEFNDSILRFARANPIHHRKYYPADQ